MYSAATRALKTALFVLLAAQAWAQNQYDGSGNLKTVSKQGAGAGAATNFWNFRLTDGTSFYDGLKVGQLPAALVGGRVDANIGAWLGSTAPTVGQKTMANSIPVVIASDQTAFPVTANAGTNLNTSALFLDATYTGRMPAGASPADNESNTITTLSRIGSFQFLFDGTTWDRAPGNSASGAKVQLSQTTTDNDVDIAQTQTYVAYRQVTCAASLDVLTVFNASGSGKVLRVIKAYGGAVAAGAVTGGSAYFKFDVVSTVGTTCTAVTIQKLDSNNAAIPAQVTANGTCTTDPVSTFTYSNGHFRTEEAAVDAPEIVEFYLFNNSGGQPITLREGQGVSIKQTALAAAGDCGFWIEFTM